MFGRKSKNELIKAYNTVVNQCVNLAEENNELRLIPSVAHCAHKTISMLCEEQIKAQQGKESIMMKFETVENFAKYIKAIADISTRYLEDKYNVK